MLVSAGAAFSGCSRSDAAVATKSQEQSSPAAPEDGVVRIQSASSSFIEVQDVAAATHDSVVRAPARVDFRDGAVSQVGTPLDGRVTAVHVAVGQAVRAGDPLVTLDCPDAASMRSAVDVSQAAVREARLDLERQKRMQQEGVGIERDLVAAETRVASAEAELARVQSGVTSIGQGNAQAVVVRAPISGTVITRKASTGMVVQRGGDPLIEIGDGSSLRIVADVFERDLSRVRTGAAVKVTLTAAGREMDGKIAGMGSVVTTGLRTAPVFITIEGGHSSLRPGMYGSVTIEASDPVMTLPVSAVLIKDGSDPVVYVQRDPLTFLRRKVVLAQPVEGQVQIVSGLSPGDKVVVRGALLLDGAADQLL